ncbi:hypothetical protein I5M32_10505 [Pedobacter sp. SD-b]|uniref:DUF5683 domain-containing protein n=1 Tax=Pedobacter segetis TaxID=2793069 RepID=A0ABS1BKH9_9SPHI|nr:DUF5683 domain-containing protein [Pedobacter segetis]MBK0383392.1 hypothetical protein [Pedobacter segetis]
MLRSLFFALFVFIAVGSYAQQNDAVSTQKDTITIKDAAKEVGFKEKAKSFTKEIGLLFKDSTKLQNPRKAVLRSAILPGWGQARNHKWWKVPLVYGGFVGLGLVYNFNNKFYKETLTESQYRKANPNLGRDTSFFYPQYKGIPDNQIYGAKDFYRRNRDLSLYSMIGFWGLQMVDAYIDAKLATFDVSDDLTLKIKPSIYIPNYGSLGFKTAIPMLSLKLNFK